MTLIVNPPLLYNMSDSQAENPEQGEGTSNAEVISFRSRASSVISTGTKFSILTMPQEHFHIDDVLEGNAPRTTSTRPGSIYSVRSIAPSLPPYEDQAPRPAPIQTSAPSGNNDSEQPPTPSTADPENALSIHYGRVVRTIDENHARQLDRIYKAHEQQLRAHEQELAATREAVDQAYRKEWKARNREMERVQEECASQIAALEERIRSLSAAHDESLARVQQDADDRVGALHEEHRAAIEKARHAIEDLWEGRWNDRTRLAAEEARRRDRERDEEWFGVIESTHPELLDEMKSAMEVSRRVKK